MTRFQFRGPRIYSTCCVTQMGGEGRGMVGRNFFKKRKGCQAAGGEIKRFFI